jgi:hypothetical protein
MLEIGKVRRLVRSRIAAYPEYRGDGWGKSKARSYNSNSARRIGPMMT